MSDNNAILSRHVWRLVFRHLSVPDLGRCLRVCQHWHGALTEPEGADEDVSLWRLKYEERWWNPLCNHSSNYLQEFRDTVAYCRCFASDMVQGRFVSDCQSRSWLLTGHSREVRTVFRLGNFIVTVAEDCEIIQFQVPILVSRPVGATVLLGDQLTTGNQLAKMRMQHCFRISPNLMAIGTFDGTFLVVHLEAGETGVTGRVHQRFQQHPRPVNAICGNRTRVITGCADGLLRVFVVSEPEMSSPSEKEDGPLLHLRGHGAGVNQLLFGSKDGIVLSSSTDQTIRLWDYNSGECLRVLQFDCIAGGVGILGCSRTQVVLKWDAPNTDSVVGIVRLSDGETLSRVQNSTSGRFYELDLYGHSMLCGTKDGHLVEFDLFTGRRTCATDASLGGTVKLAHYLGDRNTAFVVIYEGPLIVLRRHSSAQNDSWVVVRTLELRRMHVNGVLYDASHRMLLVKSQGYLVRVFLFEDS